MSAPNKAQLERYLNTMGKRVFVEHFAKFRKYARDGNLESCLGQLRNLGGAENTWLTRCYTARVIFRARKEKTALKMCAAATRVDDATRKKAAALLRKL